MTIKRTSAGSPAAEHLSMQKLPAVVDRATFQAELDALLVREKAHTREGDAIAAARRRLPMVEVDPTIQLIGPHGPVTLLEVFEGRQQLIVYYHMWHAGQPASGQCEGCTFFNGQIRELSYPAFPRCHLRHVLRGPVRGERPLPRLHGLGCRGTRRKTSLEMLLAGRQINGSARGLLPATRRPCVRDLLDHRSRCRGDGHQLRAVGHDRVRSAGDLGGLACWLATTVGKQRRPVPHERTSHRPMVPARGRALRRPRKHRRMTDRRPWPTAYLWLAPRRNEIRPAPCSPSPEPTTECWTRCGNEFAAVRRGSSSTLRSFEETTMPGPLSHVLPHQAPRSGSRTGARLLPRQARARARRGAHRRPALRVRADRVPSLQLGRAPSGESTQMAFEVEDLEATLADLRSRGVTLERFQMSGFDVRGDTIAAPDNYPSKGTGELGTFFYDSEGNLIGIASAIRKRTRRRGRASAPVRRVMDAAPPPAATPNLTRLTTRATRNARNPSLRRAACLQLGCERWSRCGSPRPAAWLPLRRHLRSLEEAAGPARSSHVAGAASHTGSAIGTRNVCRSSRGLVLQPGERFTNIARAGPGSGRVSGL